MQAFLFFVLVKASTTAAWDLDPRETRAGWVKVSI